MGGYSSDPKSDSGAGAGGTIDHSEAGAGADSRTDSAGRSADSAAGTPPLVGGVESVGMDGPEQLIREAELAAAGAPIDPSSPGAPAPLDPNGSWALITPPTVSVICGVVLPAWEIRAEEQSEISGALAQCLEQVFPGGVDGKYACWIRLCMACGAITVSRVATNGGKLPPLFLPKGVTRPTRPTPAPAPVDPMTVTSLTE